MLAAKGGGDAPNGKIVGQHREGNFRTGYKNVPTYRPNDPGANPHGRRGGAGGSMGGNALNGHPGMKQAFLISHGYHITHDGQAGPQTAAAWHAYQNGHPAAHFNTHNPYSNSYSGQHSGGGGGGGGGGNGGNGGNGGGNGGGSGNAGGGGRGGGGRGGKGGGGGLGGKGGNLAKAQTNLQYGALLNALHTNISNLTGQNAQNLSDIHDWFGHAQDTAAAGTAADTAAAGAAHDQNNQDFSGILQALGGNTQAAPMVSGMHAADQTLLQALGLNQQGFDQTQQSNLAAESAQASQNQMNTGNNALADLQSKLAQTLADKGNSLITNTAAAKEQRLQMMAELQNMSLAGKQFNLNKALGLADLKNKQVQNATLTKQLKQMGNNGRVPFQKLKSGDKIKLQQTLRPVMYDAASGKATLDPMRAWERAADQMRAAGYSTKNSPAVRTWLSQTWLQYVGDYNRAHPDKPYHPAKNGTPFPNW